MESPDAFRQRVHRGTPLLPAFAGQSKNMPTSTRIAAKCDQVRNQVSRILADLPRLAAGASPTDPLANHLVDRLRVACENAAGCCLLAESDLPAPLLTVTRSLFESLISTFWASLSDDNARTVVEASQREMARLMRNLLFHGRATVQDTTTGKNVTGKVLQSDIVAEAKRPPRLDCMAQDAKIKNIYDAIYGFLSMFAHGTATEILVRMGREEPTFAGLETSHAALESRHLIAGNRISERRATSREELERIFNIGLAI
jgi:hypothetical protein